MILLLNNTNLIRHDFSCISKSLILRFISTEAAAALENTFCTEGGRMYVPSQIFWAQSIEEHCKYWCGGWHVASMWSACCQRVANMLQRFASILSTCYQHVARMLPACWQLIASMLPVCCQHSVSMLPACGQHVAFINIMFLLSNF